ncbi:unnamed protein product [Bursaphelenchus okinawaensis]|uniref:G_PROTEIN_RECEP_F1_2 domain-containing protein n=1 Tax=Bursaphelenchus okinawaensis TaxID=465554 RepID=A0A811LA79_9BILA|nr:unnamed protein product [Bursaphelenchus okinawaensis]CAG9119390.1 unnamed protein product [Bursaphelenchus okinawaensis]
MTLLSTAEPTGLCDKAALYQNSLSTSINSLVLQLTSLPCHNTYVYYKCLMFRWPIALSSCAINFFHFAIFFERTVAKQMFKRYENGCKFLGIFLILFTWALLITLFFFSYRVHDYHTTVAVCSVTIVENEDRIRYMANGMLTCNMFIVLGEMYLWFTNRRKVKRKVYSHYSLTESYQKSENYITSVLVLPISITHSVIYFDISLCLLFYLIISRRIENNKKIEELNMANNVRSNTYFTLLQRQIK